MVEFSASPRWKKGFILGIATSIEDWERSNDLNDCATYSLVAGSNSDAMKGIGGMLYTIVYANGDTRPLSATDATTAREALAIAEALQSQHREIKFITSPQEGEFGVEMLRLLAKEEGEELALAPHQGTSPAA